MKKILIIMAILTLVGLGTLKDSSAATINYKFGIFSDSNPTFNNTNLSYFTYWIASTQLDSYWLETNMSGSWVNETSQRFNGNTANQSRYYKITTLPTYTTGMGFRIWANDSSNNINSTPTSIQFIEPYYQQGTTKVYTMSNATGDIYGQIAFRTGISVNYTRDPAQAIAYASGYESVVNLRYNTTLPMWANDSWQSQTTGSSASIDLWMYMQQDDPDGACIDQGSCFLSITNLWGLNIHNPLNILDYPSIFGGIGGGGTDIDLSGVYGFQYFHDDYPDSGSSGDNAGFTDWGIWLDPNNNRVEASEIGAYVSTYRSTDQSIQSYGILSYRNLTTLINNYNQPANNSILSNGTLASQSLNNSKIATFNVTVRSNTTIANATIYFNFTGWQPNQTLYPSDPNSYGQKFVFNLSYYPNGTFLWNVFACDNGGRCSWATTLNTYQSYNRTIRIDRAPIAAPPPATTSTGCPVANFISLGMGNSTQLSYISLIDCPTNRLTLNIDYLMNYILLNSTGVLELKAV